MTLSGDFTPLASTAARVRSYASPTAVLLAFDWADGESHPNFLGFAIRRSPGYAANQREAYLYNKLTFDPPKAGESRPPVGSDLAPIQKFLWWDGGIKTAQRGTQLTYTVTPVLGTGPQDLELVRSAEVSCVVKVPTIVDDDGIGTFFNRAVVSSQAFSREFPNVDKELDKAMDWLANGMQDAIPEFMRTAATSSDEVVGAIYHLTDNRWVVPALAKYSGAGSLVYFWKEASRKKGGSKATTTKPNGSSDDTANQYAAADLQQAGYTLDKRTKAAIMHDKFLVRLKNNKAQSVLMGSANFTPEALTAQANLLHTFESEALAELYVERQRLLREDPPIAQLAEGSGWSRQITIGGAKIRAFFPPEPQGARESIDVCVKAVKNAKRSVILCMFSPTDKTLLDSFFEVGKKGKLLFGLLNSITDSGQSKKRRAAIANGEDPRNLSAEAKVQVDLYHRSRADHKVLSYSYFNTQTAPADFLPELSTIDTSRWSTVPQKKAAGKAKYGKGSPRKIPAVHIHHKFIVIDAETENPIIYTGSANMSNNSAHRNDENLLEITGSTALAQTYFAEFMRLYEHFRARAIWNETHNEAGKARPLGRTRIGSASETDSPHDALTLRRTRDQWVRKAYKRGSPEFVARTTLAGPA